jgi:hypothetical protein
VIKLADLSVTRADYDGSTLTVEAKSDSFPLTVAGVGTLPDAAPVAFPIAAPPAAVSVSSASGAPVSFPVSIVDGDATDPGLPPVTPATDPGPVNDNTPNNLPTAPAATPVIKVADPAATLPGDTVTLDASGTVGATSYTWTQVSTPKGTTLTNAASAKPTLTLPFAITSAATTPVADWGPVVLKVVATNAAGSSESEVVVPVKRDTVTITAGARHRIGTELRVDGTSLIDGQAVVRTPATSVTIWDVTRPAAPVKLGTAPVDTLGAWPLRLKPGPSQQVTSVLVQSTRGGSATSTVTNR